MPGYSSMPVAILIDIMTKLLVAGLWRTKFVLSAPRILQNCSETNLLSGVLSMWYASREYEGCTYRIEFPLLHRSASIALN